MNGSVEKNESVKHKPLVKSFSRGVRAKISPIIWNEVWNVWEKYADLEHDSVEVVKMQKHVWVFGATFQGMQFVQLRKNITFRTCFATIEDLVITYFDGEALMMLYSEALEIFGDRIREFG